MKLTLKCIGRDDILTLDTARSASCGELRETIALTYGFSPSLLMVYRGRVLKNEDSTDGLDNQSIVIAKWRVQCQVKEQEQVKEQIKEQAEEVSRTYKGEEIIQIMRYSGDMVFNLLHSVAQKDPYMLAYLAVNPEKARTELIAYLSKPDFTLKINGPSPILDISNVDQNNISYVVTLTEATTERASSLYYSFNKDIKRTLDTLLLERVNV